jgi:hypothetical protein
LPVYIDPVDGYSSTGFLYAILMHYITYLNKKGGMKMKISRERMNQHMSIFLKIKETFSCILK